jgi:hypothetical protein
MNKDVAVGASRVCFKINNPGDMPRALLIRLDTFNFITKCIRSIVARGSVGYREAGWFAVVGSRWVRLALSFLNNKILSANQIIRWSGA